MADRPSLFGLLAGSLGFPKVQGLLDNPALGDLGFGMLASGGRLPPGSDTSFLGRLGKAGVYANERADARMLNEMRREEISKSQREQQGYDDFSKWMAANPDASMQEKQAAALQFVPELAVKGMVASSMDPIAAFLAQSQAETAATAADEKRFELSQSRSDTRKAYGQLRTAAKAFERLREIPGADAILINPTVAEMMRTGVSGTKFTKTLANLASEGIFNISKEDLPDALSAVELISKARFNVGSLSSRAVQGQANAMKGLGEGVGLDEQEFVFRENLEETRRQMEENEWDLPEEPKYPFYRNRKEEKKETAKGGYVPGSTPPPIAAEPQSMPLAPAPAEAPPAAGGGLSSLLPDWMKMGGIPPVSSVMPKPETVQGAVDATKGAVTEAYGAGRAAAEPVIAGAVEQGTRAVEGATKAGKAALDTAMSAGTEATKIVKRVGKFGLNAAGVPVYARWSDAARAVESGELTHASTPTGYIIVEGKIVDIRP